MPERELAPQNGNSSAGGIGHFLHEVPRDSGSNDDDEYEDPAPALEDEQDENLTYVRVPRIQVSLRGALAKYDEDASCKVHMLEKMDDYDNEEEVSAFPGGDFVAEPRRSHSSLRLGTCSGARS